jgi:predicted nucleic acid-binding protein
MRRVVVDTGVLGRVTNPRSTPQNDLCSLWLENLLASGAQVCIPEIVDYELRREYILGGRTASIKQLDLLESTLVYLPITTGAIRLAADLWAQIRRQGQKTADDKALDGDVNFGSPNTVDRSARR